MARIVIIGGGPAGYEAALVAAQLGAEVTVVEADGAGGACVLFDCVPSKTFIASSDVVTAFHHGGSLGVRVSAPDAVGLDAAAVHLRVKRLALAQSADIAAKLAKAGVELVHGRARLGERRAGPHPPGRRDAGRGRGVQGRGDRGPDRDRGESAGPPHRPARRERILTWRDVYDLPELPERLIVIGSGVTGAEFASAYLAAGVDVTLVSSRDRVMPHEDPDAAEVIETCSGRAA